MRKGSPDSTSPGSAGFLLSRVGAAVRAGFKDLLSQWDIRPQQFAILRALSATGEAFQQELCQALGIDSGNMVELIDGLEALGFVLRRRDPRDRRRYLLALTEEGQTSFAAMTKAVDQYDAQFLELLDQGEQAALIAALTKLYATTAEGQRITPVSDGLSLRSARRSGDSAVRPAHSDQDLHGENRFGDADDGADDRAGDHDVPPAGADADVVLEQFGDLAEREAGAVEG
jgi:DNA-binding MarR family transcriptional regulator